jgi:type III secretion protein L
MKKLFSLLSHQTVHPSPGIKVIPASEFSEFVTTSELHGIVQQEAEQFKREAVKEAETIKELAFQEGFQEGLYSLNAHLAALNRELRQLREEVHKKILPLALKAARKIIGEELKLHPDRIVDIVMTALKPITQHRKIVIYVNRADLEMLEHNKPRIKKLFEHLESFSLQERADIEPGGCIIETEAGIINAQLENQWRALEIAFASFMTK